MKDLYKYFINLSYYIILLIFIVIGLYLSYSSLTITAVMDYNMSEYTYFIKDNLISSLFFLVFFTASIAAIAKIIEKYLSLKIFYILSFTLMIAISIYLIADINLTPTWDALFVNDAAHNLISGNVEAFKNGNYLYTYPFLIPTVLYYSFLNLIFGHNYIVFQLCNLALLMLSYYYLLKLTTLLQNNYASIITTILLILFVPMYLYLIFIYSNVPSIAFTIISLYQFTYYLMNRTSRNLIYAFIFVTISLLLKGSATVVLIAYIIILVLNLDNLTNRHKIYAATCALISLLSSTIVINSITYLVNGNTPNTTYSNYALAMGSTKGGRCYGWYTDIGYQLSLEYGNDEEIKAKKANEIFFNNIKNMLVNGELVDFYDVKSKSMWTTTEFQSFWTIHANKEEIRHQGDSNAQSFLFINYQPDNDNYSRLTNSFINGKAHILVEYLLDTMQNFIYLFAVIYALILLKDKDINKIVIPLIFIGGFIFLLLWEGKAQYSLIYFILLLPISAVALSNIIEKSLNLLRKDIKNN